MLVLKAESFSIKQELSLLNASDSLFHCGKKYVYNVPLKRYLSVHFSGIMTIHVVLQQLPPSIFRIFPSCKAETCSRQMHVCVLSHVQLCVTPWTAACQAPLSMGFSRQEYWSGLPCPPPASSRPRDCTCVSYVSCIGRQGLYHQCHLGSLFPSNSISIYVSR